MCYICEICVVEAGNINKNKKCSLDSLPRVGLSANLPLCRELGGRLSANIPLCRELGGRLSANMTLCRELDGRLSANLYFFLNTASGANLFFNNSLPKVALGKEVLCRWSLSVKKLSLLAAVWALPGRASLPRARVCRES